MTLEATVMSLQIFETVFVKNVSEAMVKAIEEAIMNGDGSGKPKGVLKETAPEGQNVALAKAKTIDYKNSLRHGSSSSACL